MSDNNKPREQQKNRSDLQKKYFEQGSSGFSNKMGRPPGPSVNPNFSRPTHFYTNRTHNPNEKMKTWFGNDRFAQESRASSWMTSNSSHYNTAGTSEVGITDDIWESDLSDDFISQLMNDNFEESLIKASQANTKSTTSNAIVQNQESTSNSDNSKKSLVSDRNPSSLKPGKNTLSRGSVANLSSRSSSSSSIFSDSQKKLIKPSRSFNLANNAQSHTTEWLRNQLEKVNNECKTLKESISSKDGESKILREKLNDAKMTIEKQKMDKEIECLNIKTMLEEKIKALKKELQQAQTQILFKSKEAESNIERYKELKKVNIIEPQFSQTFSSSQSVKSFFNRSERLKSSFVASGTNLSELTQSPQTSRSIKTKNVQHTSTQTMTDEVKEADDGDADVLCFTDKKKQATHCGNELSFIIYPGILEESKPEFSIIMPPAIDYYPYDILYRDVTEIPASDNDEWGIFKNLLDLWSIEEPSGRRKKPIETIRGSRYFTSISALRSEIIEACKLATWKESDVIAKIVQHVTKMARELYIAFRDPEVFTLVSIRAREKEIHRSVSDVSELNTEFNMFSPIPFKGEIYVDLRRGVALIAALCEIDQNIKKYILKKSHFILDPKLIPKNVETFSSEEKSCINCVTDNFINEFDKRTTFIHNKASEFQANRVNDISKKKYKKQMSNLSETVSEKIAFFKGSNAGDLLKGVNKITSSLLPALKRSQLSGKEKSSEEAEKLNMSSTNVEEIKFIRFLDSKLEKSSNSVSELSHKGNSDNKNRKPYKNDFSLMDVIIKREHENWTDSSSSSVVSKTLLNKCDSDFEKELVTSTFNNFLQIKSSMIGEEVPFSGTELGEISEHEVDFTDQENIQSRKRKKCEPEPCTSREVGKPLEAIRKRDLAPLKKLRKDDDVQDDEMDTQDIQNEIEIIYHDEKNEVTEPTTSHPPEKENMEVTDIDKDDVSGTPDVYLHPEEIAAQCELLGILLEIIRTIGYVRYSLNFSALLAVTVNLLSSLTKSSSSWANQLKVHYVCTMILEILYCRPSPIVLLKIHGLLAQCFYITGFTRTLCHNSHPSKYVIRPQKIEFKRGVCLLSIISTQTELYVQNKNWDMQFEFFRWVGYLFLVEKNAVMRIYRRQRTTCGQCSCVKCLNNCIIKILTQAVVSYYDHWTEKKFTPLIKYQLEEVIKQGVKILSVILDVDHFFSLNVPLKYNAFVLFLKTVRFLHISEDFEFNLTKDELSSLDAILEGKLKADANKKSKKDIHLDLLPSSFTRVNCNVLDKAFKMVQT